MNNFVLIRTSLSILLIVVFLFGNVAPQAQQRGRTRLLEGNSAHFRGRSKLLKRDRESLAQAYAEGKTEVMLVIASAPGMNASVVNQLAQLGGKLRYREDEVDYLRLKVPLGSVDKIARLSSVEALSVDTVPLRDTSAALQSPVDGSNPRQLVIRPPDRNTPAENPYLPTAQIGAPQFIAKHPTFDGRGVTIGLIESGIPDILSPELQTATTLDGKSTRKLIDLLDALDPIDDDDYKISMSEQVESLKDQFTYKGTTYTVSPGRYHIGLLNESDFNSKGITRGDLNLDGNPPGSSRVFAVLWNKITNSLLVDTNQNHNFEDETPLSDYNVRYESGVLGKDNPTTAVRESAAFVITADIRNNFIRFFPVLNAHATATTSAAAGRAFFGGKMNGAAPGARVITIMSSLSNHGLIEGMILAMKNSQLDLVTVQLASTERFKDGASVVSTVWDRLIERYKKPIFISASNLGPGIGTMSEIALGSNVISTGAYIHRNTWFADEGLVADKNDYVANLSSRGPRQDGGFKPDLIAPSLGLYATIGSRASSKFPYELPPGYTIAAGTSEANPMAAGAAALLISGAKQTGVPYDAARLKRAMKSSARFLPDYEAHEQGDGLIQVAAAWDALQKLTTPVAISSRAPVKHVLSRYLKEPDQGPGIYEREGWTVGQSAERRIYFTRTSGSAKSLPYSVQWVGNDGTFSSPDTINLTLNSATVLPVTVNPKTPGVHSTILRLIDPANSNVVYEVMNTVIASEEFSDSNGFSISGEGQLNQYPGYKSYFFSVPENTAAFKFEMTVLKGNLRLTLLDPSSTEYSFVYTLPRGTRPPHHLSGKHSRTVVRPEPGVWEVIVVNHDFSDADRNKDRNSSGLLSQAKQAKGTFTYNASVFGVEIRSAGERVESLQGDNDVLEMSFVNRKGSFVGRTSNESLASGYFDRPTLTAADAPRVYEIDVPPGTEILRAQISAPTDSDLDLYLYECTPNRCGVYEPFLHHNCKGDGCELKAFSVSPFADETVEVVNPNPGKWKVILDPVSPRGKTECSYLDLFTHKAFGHIRSEEKTQARTGAQSWKEQIKVSVHSVPDGGRFLLALIKLVGDQNDIIGYTVNSTGNPGKIAVERRVGLGSVIVRLRNEQANSKKF